MTVPSYLVGGPRYGDMLLHDAAIQSTVYRKEALVIAKLSPREAFIDNIEDAKALMSYARAFQNKRNRPHAPGTSF